MSYDSMFKLGNDPDFQGRVRVCAYQECQATLDDFDHPDWSNLAYDTLRGADHVMEAWIRMVARFPGVADAAGDPPDQSQVPDDAIQAAVVESYPIVASMWYNPNGTVWSGLFNPDLPPTTALPPEQPGEPVIPVIAEVVPTSGPGGTVIEVRGMTLASATIVNIGADLTDLTVTDATIIGTLPDGVDPGVYPVLVSFVDGTVTEGPDFEVTESAPPSSPEVTSFTPNSGGQGTTVVILGTLLSGTTNVNIGKDLTNLTVNSDTQVTATLPSYTPPQKGDLPVVVTVDGANYTAPNTFRVT